MTFPSDPGEIQIETGIVIGLVRREHSTLICVLCSDDKLKERPVAIRVIERRAIDNEPVCIQLKDRIKWTSDDVWFTPRPVPLGINEMNRGLLWDIRVPLVQPAH